MTKVQARNAWFTVHKWIGLILAALIIPISLTGAFLVWHEPLERVLYPHRFAVSGPVALAPAAYANAARAALAPGETLASLTLPEHGGEPVVAAATQATRGGGGGRPARTLVFLDPADARVLERASSNSGILRTFHVLHGSLMIPGAGRQIVGWIGVAMLVSSISGLWLWWPTVGKWMRGLRWRRHRNLDTNLHHQMGFWIALPLFVLSLTGVWISFPAFFASLTGSGGPQRGPDRGAMMRAKPLAAPATSLDVAIARALETRPGTIRQVTWPTDLKAEWSFRVRPERGRPATVTVDDADGSLAIEPVRERGQGGVARLMRQIHDGTDMGLLWQVIIFLGGIIPAVLAVTGVIMWWRARGWRATLAERQARARGRAVAAE